MIVPQTVCLQQAVVNSVRLVPDERVRIRCLLLDSRFRVIASSDGNTLIGFAPTPGYESGLG